MATTYGFARSNPTQVFETISTGDEYQDYDQSQQDRLQMIWDEQMVDADKTSPHQNTAVLLISWDGKLDDLHTGEEVEQLGRVLEESFNFKIHYGPIIEQGKKPQVQLNAILANFVKAEDAERTLLIVYYAGHGVPGAKAGNLILAGSRVPGREAEARKRAEIVWGNAERILDNTDADVLVIFDCCYAGNLGRGYSQGRWSTRCSEFLGATSANLMTAIPGDSSFTSGLIWALKGLSTEPCGFTTSELRQRIVEAPNFPKDQVPVLCERNGSASLKHIVIAPLLPSDNVSNQGHVSRSDDRHRAIGEYLDLRLLMERKLNETEVKNLSKFFSDMIHQGDLPARRIAFLGQSPKITNVTRAAVTKWRSLTQRRNDVPSIGIPGSETDPSLLLPSPVSRNPNDVLEKASGKADRQQRLEEGGIRASFILLILAIIGRLHTMVLRLKDRAID